MAGQALALTEDESQLAVPGIPGDVIATSDFIHSKGIAIGRNAIALSDVTINLYIVVPPTEGDTAPQEPTISLPPPTDLADTSTQPPRRIPHLAYRAEMLIGRAVCRPPLP